MKMFAIPNFFVVNIWEPTAHPSTIPTISPSAHPSRVPTIPPSGHPSRKPTVPPSDSGLCNAVMVSGSADGAFDGFYLLHSETKYVPFFFK